MPGIGRFAGEDWLKGDIGYPFTLNAYGYCWGNPLKFVDLDGESPKNSLIILSGEVSGQRKRKYAENDVLKDNNGAPYVGVFYLNVKSGALGNGHVAMMLLRSDDTGDLYSYVGDSKHFWTVVEGYNDANVNHAYGLDLENILGERREKSEYTFSVINRRNELFSDKYNRAVYFSITNKDGEAMAQAAKETILSVNGVGYDNPDYNLFSNNCDQNTREWIRAGGIALDAGHHIAPNKVYEHIVDQINKNNYSNAQYGDLHDIWCKIHSNGRECTTSD